MTFPRPAVSALLLLFLCGGAGAMSFLVADGEAAVQKRQRSAGVQVSSIHGLNRGEGSLNLHNADWRSSSLEMDRRSLSILTEGSPLVCSNPNYPRIKKLADGSYLLTYQQNPIAHEVCCATSSDLHSWQTAPEPLFRKQNWKQFDGVTTDRILFSSADAIVLADGDILAFASFRLNKGYRADSRNNGIMMRRSSDNGRTWGEYERIFTGTTWEPSAIQLSTGEIQVYFTDADPVKGDSGTSLLRSADNGKTWEYARKVVRQKSGTAIDGSDGGIFTDQMPVAVRLNASDSIAVAFESRFGRGSDARFNLGLAYSDGKWTSQTSLSEEDDSPQDRQSNVFADCAAPYIRQFPSGETVLTFNTSGRFFASLGDPQARSFGQPHQLFDASACWGSCEIADDHTLIAVYPSTTFRDGANHSEILLAKFVLNHRVKAARFTPRLDGSNSDWATVQDALFIGSESQAQVTFRFACDESNLYCLAECRDRNLTDSDGLRLMFRGGDTTAEPFVLELRISASGRLSGRGRRVRVASSVFGTVDGVPDDGGYVAETAIPLKKLSAAGGRILFNAVLSGEDGEDTFTGLDTTDPGRWLPVELADLN